MYIFQSSLNNDALEKIKQLGSSLQINVLKTFADDNRNSFNMVVNRPKYQGKVIPNLKISKI